jgi:hypothetical protein
VAAADGRSDMVIVRSNLSHMRKARMLLLKEAHTSERKRKYETLKGVKCIRSL